MQKLDNILDWTQEEYVWCPITITRNSSQWSLAKLDSICHILSIEYNPEIEIVAQAAVEICWVVINVSVHLKPKTPNTIILKADWYITG